MQQFPKQGWFPQTEYSELPNSSIFSGKTIYEICQKSQSMIQCPNEFITLGDKKFPQLVWYSYILGMVSHPQIPIKKEDCIQVIKALLQNSADVNRLSTSQESALLFSLEHINLWEVETSCSQDRTLFNIISSYPHKKETINMKTSKQEMYPLMLAVQSGRYDVVKKVLDMGAEVDMVNFQGITPLYMCMTMLSHLLKSIEKLMGIHMSLPHDAFDELEVVNIMRRSNTLGMPTSSSELMNYYNQMENPKFNFIAQLIPTRIRIEQLQKYSSIEELHKIAQLLIERGANVNYPHNIGALEGYTPLMLAIENNDPVSVKMMLKAGGDIWQPYFENGQKYYCQNIKEHWNSHNVSW